MHFFVIVFVVCVASWCCSHYADSHCVKSFPYLGRRTHFSAVRQILGSNTERHNDLFGTAIFQFEREYKACLERRKHNEPQILNIVFPIKTDNRYLEYLGKMHFFVIVFVVCVASWCCSHYAVPTYKYMYLQFSQKWFENEGYREDMFFLNSTSLLKLFSLLYHLIRVVSTLHLIFGPDNDTTFHSTNMLSWIGI
jgi:hypothetical protein